MSKQVLVMALLLILCGCKSRVRVVRQEQQQLRALTEVRDTLRIRWWSDGSVAELPQLRGYPLPRRMEGDSMMHSSGGALLTRHSVLEAQEETSHATEEARVAPSPEKRPSRFLEGLWTGVGLAIGLLLAIRLLWSCLRKGIL